MKWLILSLIFFRALEAIPPCLNYPVYTIRDVGEAAFFIHERLACRRIAARTIIINAWNHEILYDETSHCFFPSECTERAYCAFVGPVSCNQLPSPSVQFLMLVDVRGHRVFMASYDEEGCFLDLRPLLCPIKD